MASENTICGRLLSWNGTLDPVFGLFLQDRHAGIVQHASPLVLKLRDGIRRLLGCRVQFSHSTLTL